MTVSIKPIKRFNGGELEKRTYLPFVVSGKCPTCGKSVKLNLADDYLSYPSVGVNEVSMYHEDKDGNECEWVVRLVLGFTLAEAA